MRTLKTLPSRTLLRAPIVLLAVLSWLAVSNHCALAALDASSATIAAPSCHGTHEERAPAKQKKEGDVECCKVLRATLPSLAKNLAPSNASAFAIALDSIALFSGSDQLPPLCPLELDTGPPGRISFAEIVLQRSLLAHAPPSLG
jgi:hypothetical protein